MRYDAFSSRARVFFFICIIAGMSLLSSFPALSAAEEKPPREAPDERQIWMRINVLCITESGYGAIGEKDILPYESLQSLVSAKKARELETLWLPMQCGQETKAHIGHRFPVTWFDVKESQYQIIFVDVGIKFFIKPEMKPGEKLDIEVRSDISTVEDYRQEIEKDSVFYFPSTKNNDNTQLINGIKNGETMIISSLQGIFLEDVLKDLGDKAAYYEKKSRLIIAMTPYISARKTAASESTGIEYPSSLEIKTIRISGDASKGLLADGRISDEMLAGLLKSGKAGIIETGKIRSSGKTASMLTGRKYPLTYYDPRSGFYQVVYIDIARKMVFECVPLSSGRWTIKSQLWLANADPSKLFGLKRDQIPLKIYTIASDQTLELGKGESGIILALQGEYYYKVIKEILFPGISFSPEDMILFTVTVR